MSHYGRKADLGDFRDLEGPPHAAAKLIIPPHVDMRPKFPPVYDQLALGSCVFNAIGAATQFERARQGLTPDFIPSRLFPYYNVRVMEGTVDSDAGASIRDGIKSVARQGDCPETQWPYDIAQFATKPPPDCYAQAIKYRALNYWRVPRSLTQMRGCLAAGYPFVFGISVYTSFESDAVAQTGIVPMPDPSEQLLGGHAILAVGFDDPTRRFIFRNSWSAGWADGGHGYIPYDYLMNQDLSSDFWTIKLESA